MAQFTQSTEQINSLRAPSLRAPSLRAPSLRAPSRASEPIIKLAIINFHDNSVPIPDCLITENLTELFGIVNIQMRDEIPIIPKIHFSFTVDRSGSMTYICGDGKTKMEQIIHTLENMIRIFHQKTDTEISIRVQSFDGEVYVNVNTVDNIGQKTQAELDEIIYQVRSISPGGTTDIEKALKAANTHLDAYMKEHPETHVAHILCTDGEITDGSADKKYLKTLVSDNYPSIFMGYGLEHDATLLKGLASTGQHNEYRFVDNLENSGLVYGEVIHQLLYPALEDASLLAEGCEIYNYATNTWATKLDVGNLISDQHKIFHIRALVAADAQIAIYGRTIHQTRLNEDISSDIVFQTHARPVNIKTADKCDLTNYMFRQQTQEYLFKTNALLEKQYELEHSQNDRFAKYNKICYQGAAQIKKLDEELLNFRTEKELLKKQIKEFFKTMLEYITSVNLKEDVFFKTLCDDMYIALKSFDTQHGMMFAAARQTSQGRQQTYSSIPAEHTEVFAASQDIFNMSPPSLKRGVSMGQPSQSTRQSVVNTELDDDLNYTLSQKQTSAYSTVGVLKMMRDVSYRAPEPATGLSIELPSDTDLPFP